MPIENILIPVLAVICGINFYMFFLKPNIQGWKNRRQPTITIRATVSHKEQTLDNLGYGTRDGGYRHTVTFHTADGLVVTLTVSRETYWAAEPGVTGTLTYQGTKCERFDPNQ